MARPNGWHTARMPNYRRHYIPGHPVFLTMVTRDRQTWLAKDECIETLFSSMRWAKKKYPFHHIAHVILPDHVHWILTPIDGIRFSDIVGAVKRDLTWRLKASGREGPFWQKRFYDHVIRGGHDLGRHSDYVHFNPVKHGYASRPADYRWSSFGEWVKRDLYATNWGASEPKSIASLDLG